MTERASEGAQREARTLAEVADGDGPGARAAAALVEAGVPAATTLAELRPGRVTRELAETLARELAELYRELGDVYASAFVETGSGAGASGGGPERRVPWWRRLLERG